MRHEVIWRQVPTLKAMADCTHLHLCGIYEDELHSLDPTHPQVAMFGKSHLVRNWKRIAKLNTGLIT